MVAQARRRGGGGSSPGTAKGRAGVPLAPNGNAQPGVWSECLRNGNHPFPSPIGSMCCAIELHMEDLVLSKASKSTEISFR